MVSLAIVPLIVAGIGLLAGGLLIESRYDDHEATPAGQAAHTSRFFDAQAFERSLVRAESEPAEPMPGVRAVIIPHHWVAGHLILSGLRDLAATGPVDRVILLGPDHTNSGTALVTTSGRAWQTPFGFMQPDSNAVALLTGSGLARNQPDVLELEHSIAGIVPAIAYYLPDAEIVPLALKHAFRPDEVRDLASALVSLLEERTVLVAAVDFSHYLPADQARAMNAETLAALASLDTATILSYGDEHLDSQASIATLLEVMRALDATAFELRADTNSAEVTGEGGDSVTSYVTGYYH
jgi:AmmeMemoRadiSam system protein B